MIRYAVLYDLDVDRERSSPIGAAFQSHWDTTVYLCIPEGYGLKTRITDEFSDLQPDLEYAATRPGDDRYLERVLASLIYTFGIGPVKTCGTQPPTGHSTDTSGHHEQPRHADSSDHQR